MRPAFQLNNITWSRVDREEAELTFWKQAVTAALHKERQQNRLFVRNQNRSS
jgi:hypothetical protein